MVVLTFNPFALLIARKGLSTRKTLKTFTSDIGPALNDCVVVALLLLFLNNETTDSNETATTNRSNRLKNDRQNAPSCITKPYEIILKMISKVKTAVKK